MTVDSTTAPRPRSLAADIGILILRIPVGVMFINAAWMKFFKMGVGEFVNKASGAIPSYVPHNLGMAYLHAVPFAEMTVGVCLILGLLTRLVGVITALMLLSFMMAVTGFKDPAGGPFHSSVTYLCVALGLAFIGPGRISLDTLLFRRRKKS